MENKPKKCAFIALIGLPNSGKSTLLNHILGSKVSIVTHKPQTTRFRIMGISILQQTQLVFMDTPGIFEPTKRLDRAMVHSAWTTALDADEIVLLVDSQKPISNLLMNVIEKVGQAGKKVIVALNKIDLVKKEVLLELSQKLYATEMVEKVFMISALKGKGTEDLLSELSGLAPKGPWHFPEDQLSSLPERLMASEITREKLFLHLHQELPYALTVETETWEVFDNGNIKIKQTIYVERDSQRAIILGKKGTKIKQVGELARRELEHLLDKKIHLFLFVKVDKKWQDRPDHYRAMGLEYESQ